MQVQVILLVLVLPFALCQTSFVVNTGNITAAWNHFFERCVGSGHAALALRADYQAQLTQAHNDLGFQQVRFHGLFVDDMSVVLPMNNGSTGMIFSFFNIDRVYDFLLSIGMKPLVELSFMPKMLASGNTTWSHYDANVTPPERWQDWAALVTALVSHLVDRYGLEEIRTWNFEVWNEPNCCPNFFWTGTQEEYFEFYNHTAWAVKAVDSQIRVGGPATAMSSWIPEFLEFCTSNNVPLDFISTHEYPTDPPGPQSRTFFTEQLQATRKLVGDRPLYYTEYDDGYNSATSYGAGFIVLQNYLANNVVDILSFWVFSDIFEEAGLYPDPYSTGFMPVDGLMNVYGIPKPSYRAFQLLHWTGDQLVETQPNNMYSNNETVSVFAVTGNNTSIFVVNWNVMGHNISTESVHVTVTGLENPSSRTAVAYWIDSTHTTSFPTWMELGEPLYLTPKQVKLLNQASMLVPQPLSLIVNADDTISFDLSISPQAVVNVIIK